MVTGILGGGPHPKNIPRKKTASVKHLGGKTPRAKLHFAAFLSISFWAHFEAHDTFKTTTKRVFCFTGRKFPLLKISQLFLHKFSPTPKCLLTFLCITTKVFVNRSPLPAIRICRSKTKGFQGKGQGDPEFLASCHFQPNQGTRTGGGPGPNVPVGPETVRVFIVFSRDFGGL